MKEKLRPEDFTIIDEGITTKAASKKYPEQHFLMMNMRFNANDESIGDIFFVGSREETSSVELRLEGFNGIGSFAGEAIILRSLGLNSLR